MTSLLHRIGAFFLEPADDAETSDPGRVPLVAAPTAPRADGRSSPLGFAAASAARADTAPPRARPDAAGSAPPAPDGPGIRGFAPPSAGRVDAAGFASPPSDGSALHDIAQQAARPEAAVRAAPAMADDAGTVVAADGGFAVVLGAPADAVPVAAACAGELRAQARAAAAVMCAWGGGESPAGATTPAVRRLAARLAASGLDATASGRLAWLALDRSPADAATQVRRARALSDCPVVLAVAGPRPPALEPLLAEADLALVVLPADAEAPLRALALASLPSNVSLAVPPLPSGPPRWAAIAGLARMRSLKPVPR